MLMLLSSQLTMLADVSDTGEEIDLISQALWPSSCPSWHLPTSLA